MRSSCERIVNNQVTNIGWDDTVSDQLPALKQALATLISRHGTHKIILKEVIIRCMLLCYLSLLLFLTINLDKGSDYETLTTIIDSLLQISLKVLYVRGWFALVLFSL